MLVYRSNAAVTALALAAIGLTAMPMCAYAQDNQSNTNAAGTESLGPNVRLQLENADLYTALKLLFAQTKSQYTLDPALRGVFVTVSIRQPFRNALETLLRAGSQGQQLTYKLENDVYSIVPKAEDVPVAETVEQDTKPAGQPFQLKKYFSTRFKYNSYFLLEVLKGANMIPSIYPQRGGAAGLGAFGGGALGGGQGGFGGGGYGGGGMAGVGGATFTGGNFGGSSFGGNNFGGGSYGGGNGGGYGR